MMKSWLFVLLLISRALLAEDTGLKEENGISLKLHRENFFYPYARVSPLPRGAKKQDEVQFQISFKLIPLKFQRGELALSYTQRSFWQLYDARGSRPFRETNYSPEVFFRYGGKQFFIDIGYEHESNGQSDPESRSWDRGYLTLNAVSRNFKISLKSWAVIDEDSYGEDEIERKLSMRDFYGYHQLEAATLMGTTVFKVSARNNFQTKRGFLESKLLFLINKGLYWSISYSKGHGSGLRNYDENLETIAFGVLMRP